MKKGHYLGREYKIKEVKNMKLHKSYFNYKIASYAHRLNITEGNSESK